MTEGGRQVDKWCASREVHEGEEALGVESWQRRERRPKAPKVRENRAQGAALGKDGGIVQAPKGREKAACFLTALTQGCAWAMLSRSFGADDHQRSCVPEYSSVPSGHKI